ncbi:hypothetical protein ACJJIQ_05155 [Microbulbifer sp. ANSA003]|uniref:hypothetical protein n=1 Tax=Microbulbifer sp. ANSA003 TaxID=3243360 RepID=UPI004041D9DE
MAKQTSMATMVANLELRSTQYKREMDQATARNKKLTRELKSTSAAGDMFGRSMRGAAQGVAAIDGPLGGISGRVGALNGLLASGATSWALFGAGVAGVVATFYQSIRAGEEMERGQLKIEGLLRATGNASGRTAQQLDEQARSVARATLASISGIRDAQGVLLTFKSVQADVFDNAIVLSQDLAAVMGGDAKSAALQLGKALEDPATGLTALKRSGVSFTEVEKEQIRTMQESGRVAEAQRYILAKLAQQVGGAGSAEAGGLTGAVDSLAQSWQEFLEEFSRTSGSTGVATRAIQGLTGVLDNSHELAEGLGTAFTALTVLMAGRFAGAIGPRVAQLALLNAETYKATVQTNAFGQVVGRTTIATRTATMAAAGLKSAFAFLGGPVGVITVAVASLVAWNASQPTAEAHAETLTGKINELTSSWKKLTDAQRINREQKVLVERDGLQKEINKLIKQRDLLRDGGTKEGSRFGYQVALGNDDSRVRELNDQIDTLNQALKEADAGLENLGKSNKARLREETEAEFKAALEREASERSAAMARLQAEQESGAQQLSQLDEFLADRRGKIQLDHEQRLQQIATLQIAEEELTKRGFDSIEQLQEEYSQRERERYQAALAEEAARREEKRQREQAALAEEQLRRELAHQQQIAAEQALFDKLTSIQEQQAEIRRQSEAGLNQFVLYGAQNLMGQMTDLTRKGTGEQSAIYKAAFLAQKAVAVAQTIMNAESASIASLSMPPIGLGPVAGAPYAAFVKGMGYASAGIIAGTAIAGIAHGGLDYVPKESTYLLDKGERVLSPNQNTDLTKALRGGGLQGNITVNLIEDASKAGQVERLQGLTEEDVINIYVANVREGGAAANINESTYNLSRNGF